jgi:hypothetical protein
VTDAPVKSSPAVRLSPPSIAKSDIELAGASCAAARRSSTRVPPRPTMSRRMIAPQGTLLRPCAPSPRAAPIITPRPMMIRPTGQKRSVSAALTTSRRSSTSNTPRSTMQTPTAMWGALARGPFVISLSGKG